MEWEKSTATYLEALWRDSMSQRDLKIKLGKFLKFNRRAGLPAMVGLPIIISSRVYGRAYPEEFINPKKGYWYNYKRRLQQIPPFMALLGRHREERFRRRK